MVVSLGPVRDLCARLGSPEQDFPAVHVAGSKGKGSTSALVAAALGAAGVRVALYASPHVERLEERLTIAGAEVDSEVLALALERALAARDQGVREGGAARDATWFDLLTAAAFLICSEARIEMAVVECGLGGRLDSTNVVHGPVAAITNIYLEHTAVLGTTRAAIAAEKAGIIKAGSTVVAGALAANDEALAVIQAVARERGARCVVVEHAAADSIERRNRSLATAILAQLDRAGARLEQASSPLPLVLGPEACDQARLPGRTERRMAGTTRVVLDGAHVPESLELLLRDLAEDPGLAGLPVVVIGMGREKNAQGLLKALRHRTDRVLCSSVGDGSGRGAEEVETLAREFGLDACAVPDPAAALEMAVRTAGTRGWVLVTGSLHLVGAVRRYTRPCTGPSHS